MAFETPLPDLDKIRTAWETWERGEEQPGKTLSNLKTAGLDEVIRQLIDSGWPPRASA